MEKSLIGSLVLSLILIGCVTVKPLNEMNDEELTNELIAYSRIDTDLNSIPQALDASLAQQQKDNKLPESLYNLLRSSMKDAFNPDLLKSPIHTAIYSNLTRKEKMDVIKWYRSETGQLIRIIENYTQTPQGQQQFYTWLTQMENQKKKLSDDEVAFAVEVARHSGAMEVTVETVSAITIGMLVGVNSTLPSSQRLPSRKLNKQISAIKGQLFENLSPMVILTMHYSYGRLQKKQKEEFLTFLKQGPGKTFFTVIGQAITQSFSQASVRVGKSIGQHLANGRDENTAITGH